MRFNPDINKQAQEVIFSRKHQKSNHPSLTINSSKVTQSEIQKHLEMFGDSKLDFKEHMQNVLNKVSKAIRLLRKLQKILPRPPLITIFKSFTRAHLGYGDIIHDQAYNVSFHQKMKSNDYNAKLGIIGAIRRTSRENFYHELCCFYKFFKTYLPKCLFYMISTAKRAYITRNNDKVPLFKVKHNYFKNFFFPSTEIERNKLDLNIRYFESLTSFKGNILKFICLSESSFFLCSSPKGMQLLTRSRFG